MPKPDHIMNYYFNHTDYDPTGPINNDVMGYDKSPAQQTSDFEEYEKKPLQISLRRNQN